jgi:hypothetical protein
MSTIAPAGPNVRLRTNVLNLRVFGPDHRTRVVDRWVSSSEVQDQLFFWDLLELSRHFPDLVSSARAKEAMLTQRQLAERHAFLREGFRGGSLWGERSGTYRPIAPAVPVRPFFEAPRPDSLVPPAAPESDGEIPAEPAGTPAVEEPGDEVVPPVVEGTDPTTPCIPPDPSPALVVETEPSPAVPATGVAVSTPCPVALRDIDQDAVVDAPVQARLLVLAPPGTGKTHTLIRRVQRLVESGEATGPHAITVLSFTRAAVAEVVSRITSAVSEGASDDLRYVTVRTFDSFASQMLRLDLQPNQMPTGYEARIQRLRNGLHRHELPRAAEEIARIRCLLVDEVQDLVGERADLVLALVRRVEGNGGGIVLLGDFAQAIYDYQVEDSPRQRSSADFLEYIRNYFEAGELTQLQLRTNYRVTDAAMRRFVERAREAMGEYGTSPDGQQLGALLQDLGPAATLTSLPRPAPGRKVAVLTRSNLQAFHFSEWCHQRSLACATVQGSTSSYCPGWVGRLSLGWRSPMMSREDAAVRWAAYVGARAGVTFDQAFARLERARVVAGGQIDMCALSRAVLEQRQELTAQDTSAGGLYVSTIHRSKGLEFDEVYLLDPSGKRATWQGSPEEVRVVYVAATRARSKLTLLRADAKALGIRYRSRRSAVRQHHHDYDAGTGTNRLFLDGFAEIDSETLLDDLPGEHASPCQERITARQEALWAHFSGGGRTMQAVVTGGTLVYVVPGGATGAPCIPVCRASVPLVCDLLGLGALIRAIPAGLADVPVCDLATVAFPADDDEATELLGSGRLMLAPVPRGWATVA